MTTPAVPTAPRLGTDLYTATPDVHDDAFLTGLDVAPYWADVSVEFAEVAQCRVGEGSFADSRWHKSRWTDLAFDGTDLANVEFTGGWTRIELGNVRATGLLSTESVWEHVLFADAVADLLTMRFSTLRTVTFRRCSLNGADFTGSNLRHVWFDTCDLSGAHFDQVTLEQVSFTDCELGGLSGITDLRGATVQPRDPLTFAHDLANAMGITLR